uniref:ASH domain-containing protein n=1 Tax=Mesocestoides corti TaxID=53468 RepID=A0A5K3EYJ4_MESCO
RNTGQIACRVKLELTCTEANAFEVEVDKDSIETTSLGKFYSFRLNVGETRNARIFFRSESFNVTNHLFAHLKVVAEGNKYESEVIELYGLVPNSVLHGPVIIETPRSDQVRADALHLALNPYFNAEIPPSCLGPAWMSDLQGGDVEEILQNHLNFGDCYVGCTLSSHFVLRYPDINGERSEISLATSIVDSSPSFNFAWPHDHPSLRFEPPSGELRPHTSLRICVYFHSDQPVKYRFFPVRCQLTEAPNFESSDNISQKNQGFGYDELALGSARSYEPPQNQTPLTQQSLRKTKSARSNNLRDASGTGSKSAREPLNPKSPQKEEFFVTDDEMSNGALFLELLFTAVCDFVEYELEKTSIKFPDTAIWGKSVQTLQIRNTGLVTMTFTFATASYDQPFEAEPSECLILPGQSLPLKFVFCPTKPGTFDSVFNLLVPNTTETCDPQKSITVIGKAFVKPIKLALPKSDYQPKNPQCDPFWHSAQVLEIVATGNGRKVTRSFEVMNTSEEVLELKMRQVNITEFELEYLICETPLKPGKSSRIDLSLMGLTRDAKEAYLTLEMQSYRIPLVVVARTRDPIVAFDRGHVSLEKVPLGQSVEAHLYIVNAEEMPLEFKFEDGSFGCNESVDKLLISPIKGTLLPTGKYPIRVKFRPTEDRRCNFNVLCKVENRQRPLHLNVKVESLKCFATAWLLNEDNDGCLEVEATIAPCLASDSSKAIILASRKLAEFPSLRENIVTVDFGEVFLGCERTRHLRIVNQVCLRMPERYHHWEKLSYNLLSNLATWLRFHCLIRWYLGLWRFQMDLRLPLIFADNPKCLL